MVHSRKFLNRSGTSSPISGFNSNSGAWNNSENNYNTNDFGYRNYMARLPEVYVGHPNRADRYNQWDVMKMDPSISSCLDIISEFSTQRNEHNMTPFQFEFKDDPTPHEVELLVKQLQQWCKLNEFESRIFKIFRNTLVYGDQVFIRDPETFKLFWIDMVKVIKVIVNESEGKKPEQYVIKDININLQNLSAAQKTTTDLATNPATGMGGTGGGTNTMYTAPSASYSSSGSRFTIGQSEAAIDAKHVVHVSLTEGLDNYWPFGVSVLDPLFITYKQKSLLEDAILIYRIARAPERRVFKIDVGNMPSHMAMSYIERIKNEVHQRRMPSYNGGQGSPVDATYNSLSTNEDYYFPVSADGRGSTVEMLAGGSNLGEVNDLLYFDNKLARGLMVPSSYLPTGPEDSQVNMSDGRMGTAMIQEFRFNQYCTRLQNYVGRTFDQEFKLFLRWRGFNIDTNMFNLTFNPPQNFASYRQAELDSSRVGTFTTMEALPYISKRFALERFMGMSEEEIKRNEKLWEEENKDKVTADPQGSDLRNIGISSGDFASDMDTAGEIEDMSADTEAAPEIAGPVGSPDAGGDVGAAGAAGSPMQI